MSKPRNIIAIDRVSVDDIVGYERIGVEEVSVGSGTVWESMNIKIPARLSISEKVEDGVRFHTAQLTFKTCDAGSNTKRFAYRCRTADGQIILIGKPGRPYPVTNVGREHPDNMGDSQLEEVSVKWTNEARIPYIIG